MSDDDDQRPPLYPNERAFILKFRGDGAEDAEKCSGRVEHLVSGRGVRFSSMEELRAFIHAMIAAGALDTSGYAVLQAPSEETDND